MFAKIGQTKHLSSALNYNEKKVALGKAEYLEAGNFVKDIDQLTMRDKSDRFFQRTSLNEKTTVNIITTSINFHVSEKISNDLMRTLAKRYLADMGFEKQPFLIYRHYDSAHPHCHVLTTSIQADGSRIEVGKPQCRQSHKITQNLEKEFSLYTLKPGGKEDFKIRGAQRVVYGETPLKRAISDVLNTIVDYYKYTSLSEFKAILRLYNVGVSRGKEDSFLYQHNGLLYYALDKNGNRKGPSIKASDFLLKPTLARLEEKFALNVSLRDKHHQRVETAIDWTLAGSPPDWKGFQQSMEKEGISVIVQADKKGGSEGIFFIDHESKCAFKGESLGQQYLLKAIQENCALEQYQEELEERQRQRHHLSL